MPAGKQVVLGDFVKAEHFVNGGHRVFRGVQRTLFKGRKDFAAGHQGRRGTDAVQNLAAKAREADFEALKIAQAGDRLAEPAVSGPIVLHSSGWIFCLA